MTFPFSRSNDEDIVAQAAVLARGGACIQISRTNRWVLTLFLILSRTRVPVQTGGTRMFSTLPFPCHELGATSVSREGTVESFSS